MALRSHAETPGEAELAPRAFPGGDSVETLRTPNMSRGLVLVAVAGVHALVIGVLLSRSRSISLSFPTVIPITAVFLKRPARPRSPFPPPPLQATPAQAVAALPITISPPAIAAIRPSGPAIDWKAEASRSVARILEPPRRISFGFPAGGQSAITPGVPSRSSPHYRGESYRTEGGGQVYWLNDHCYMASDPAPLFEPDILRNARVARIECK